MKCSLCPVSCGTDRKIAAGYCGVSGIKIAKYYLHPFEEPCISFNKGSGCIFFCGCSLKCVFCQNYSLSRAERGKIISVEELAAIFKELEDIGADNINLVNPTHYVEDIIKALEIYRPSIPVVYNTHGYEKIETLKKIDKYVDIYLPDLKFIDSFLSKRYTGKANYSEYALPAIKFMSQKKKSFDTNGKMLSGCIIRHLILPQATYDSVEIVKFVATLSHEVVFSLMSQYTPYGEIEGYKELQRRITKREYDRVLFAVKANGLDNVYLQDELSADEKYIPQWDY